MSDVLIAPRKQVKAIKDLLKQKGYLDTSKKIISTSRDHYAIAITSNAKEVLTSGCVPEGCVLSTMVLPLATIRQQPHQVIKDVLTSLLPQQSVTHIPRHWIKHGDLIVLPSNSFSDVQWDSVNSRELWRGVAEALGAKRLAIEDRVCDDDYRTPTCRLLLGDNGLVEHVDNKVHYVFDITKSMFCHGNITEKIRMSKLSCDDEVILDLFAGIGYFTLPLLVHTSAKRVHSCDWSADAIDALHNGLLANHVADKCVVHHIDCRKLQLPEPVDRVILGLIPSSQCGYETACRHVNPSSGGWFHIHGTVNSKPVPMVTITKTQHWNNCGEQVCKEINDLLCRSHDHSSWITRLSHVEHVKSYAPHIDHIVIDIECRRSN